MKKKMSSAASSYTNADIHGKRGARITVRRAEHERKRVQEMKDEGENTEEQNS